MGTGSVLVVTTEARHAGHAGMSHGPAGMPPPPAHAPQRCTAGGEATTGDGGGGDGWRAHSGAATTHNAPGRAALTAASTMGVPPAATQEILEQDDHCQRERAGGRGCTESHYNTHHPQHADA